MTKKDYCILFFAAFTILSINLAIQKTPGYMDAEYYYAGGLQLEKGNGFQEDFIWNYLNQPEELPQPSNSYWMPLVSIIAWLGMWVSGTNSFSGARIIFFVFACFIPPMTAWFTFSLSRMRWAGILSGVIALFPIFYSAYLVTTDIFAINIILGIVWFQLAFTLITVPQYQSTRYHITLFCFGTVGALLYLTRVDGIVWVVVGGGYVLYLFNSNNNHGNTIAIHKSWVIVLYLAGVLALVTPWLIRNYFALDAFFPSGVSKSLWFITYDDLYSYPAEIITFNRWIQNGIFNAIRARLLAFVQNIQTMIGVQGGIIFFPLIIAGLLKLKSDLRVKLGVIIWGSIFLLMSVFFPFAGSRGGFFHGAAAVQPLFWAVTPVGLDRLITWGERRRGWNKQQALPFFSVGILLLAFVASIYVFHTRVIGNDWQFPVWSSNNLKYQKIEDELKMLGLSDKDIVLINNPPGYWITNGRSALSVPDGGVDALLNLANDFNVHYLVLEKDHPIGLKQLYSGSMVSENLEWLSTVDDTKIFFISNE